MAIDVDRFRMITPQLQQYWSSPMQVGQTSLPDDWVTSDHYLPLPPLADHRLFRHCWSPRHGAHHPRQLESLLD